MNGPRRILLPAMSKLAILLAAVLGVMVVVTRIAVAGAPAAVVARPYRLIAPLVSRGTEPPPYVGPIVSLDVAAASVGSQWPVEERSTTITGGGETLEEPTSPNRIAWYPAYGRPGFRGANTTFAGHVNYVGWSLTAFAYLNRVQVGDSVYITMGDGTVYTYSVRSVDLVRVEDLDMAQVLMPRLDNHTERVTFISCGGDFFIAPGIGGKYSSRLIITAERYIPDY